MNIRADTAARKAQEEEDLRVVREARDKAAEAERAATAIKKAENEQALRLFREQNDKQTEAARLRSQARANEVLIQMSEDADDDLEAASEGAPAVPSTKDVLAAMMQMMATMQMQQKATADMLAALVPQGAAVAAPVVTPLPPTPSTPAPLYPPPSTSASTQPFPADKGKGTGTVKGKNQGSGKGTGKNTVFVPGPPTEHDDDFAN